MKKTILIIEDDFPLSQGLAQALTERGHAVETAINGFEGFHTYTNGEFDLVITDINMPICDGIVFMEKMATYLASNKKTQKIVCFSSDSQAKKDVMLNLGCEKVYQKKDHSTLMQECGL